MCVFRNKVYIHVYIYIQGPGQELPTGMYKIEASVFAAALGMYSHLDYWIFIFFLKRGGGSARAPSPLHSLALSLVYTCRILRVNL